MPQYDLAVVGAELGGLASAALLSATGKKSIVCTTGTSLAEALGTKAKEGFSFSVGPALSYGFEPGGAFQQLFRDLSIDNTVPAHAPGYQVALPDRRITVTPNQDDTIEELRREFPREIQKISNFYRDLKNKTDQITKNRIVAYLSQRWSARSFIGKYNFSKELLSFFDVQALFFFQRPVLELSLMNLITLCTHRPFQYYGGYEKLAERLAAIVLAKGGDILYSEPLTEIMYRNNRANGIRTTQGIIETGSVLQETSDKRIPVLFLGVHDQVVPVGMDRDVLYLPDYSQPREFLVFSLSAKDDSTAAPKGMRAITVTFYTTKNLPHDKNMLVSQTTGLIPFLGDFLVLSEESLPRGTSSVPAGLTLKPLRSGKSEPLLFRTSKRNVYALHEVQHAPLQLMPAVRKLVMQIM